MKKPVTRKPSGQSTRELLRAVPCRVELVPGVWMDWTVDLKETLGDELFEEAVNEMTEIR